MKTSVTQTLKDVRTEIWVIYNTQVCRVYEIGLFLCQAYSILSMGSATDNNPTFPPSYVDSP